MMKVRELIEVLQKVDPELETYGSVSLVPMDEGTRREFYGDQPMGHLTVDCAFSANVRVMEDAFSEMAARVAGVKKANDQVFEDLQLQRAWLKALAREGVSEDEVEYIQAYRKYSEEPSLEDFEAYMEAYEEGGGEPDF